MRNHSILQKRFMFIFLFVPFGLTTFITYLFSARVTHRKELRSYAIIYFICAYSTMLSYFLLPRGSMLILLIFILNLIIWIESLFHGFRIWNEVLNIKLPYISINNNEKPNNESLMYLKEIINSSYEKLKQLEIASTKLSGPIGQKVSMIKKKCEKIVIHVERYPEDYKHVRSFFTGYLNSVVEIGTILSIQTLKEEEIQVHIKLLDELLQQFEGLIVKLENVQNEKLMIEITQLNEVIKQDQEK